MRRTAIATLTAVLVLSLTGCMGVVLNACPAIGYVSGVTVDASVYGDGIHVQLCSGDAGCSPGPGEDESTPTEIWGARTDDGGAFSFASGTPDAVTVRVFDGMGVLLKESSHELDWEHSTDRCGGPSTVDPIVLVG